MNTEEKKKKSLNKEWRFKQTELKQLLVVLFRAPALVGNIRCVNTMQKQQDPSYKDPT
jgi:hypothetical protein